ncbi:MAG: CotH kinase family protein [bacterium]|nr:CotH kinase family protein [bacterium]
MKWIGLLLLVFSVQFGNAQTLYNPQTLYDGPGGLFDPNYLRTVDINFHDPGYHQILVDGWTNETGIRLPATVLFDGIFYSNVMVRYKGNSTFAIPNDNNNPKLPYNLDFNDSVPGQFVMGYRKMKLANAAFDPTFAKEITGYDIYRRYLPSPQANLMRLNVQGDYLGLYVNTEAIDKTFLEKHFGESGGALFKCDPIQQFGQSGGPTGNSDLTWLGPDTSLYYNHYKLRSLSGWSELVELIDVLNNDPANLDTILNIDRVLWAFAVNQVIANLDTYNGLFQHNYYLYQTGDGLFQMIPWDVSESFVGALLQFNPNFNELYEYDPYNGYNSSWTPLVQLLTSDPNSHYGKIYTAHMRTILNESLDAQTVQTFVDSLQSLGQAAATADPNKLFGMNQYYSNVTSEMIIPFVFSAAGITSTIDLRKPYLESLPSFSAAPPTVGNPTIVPQQGPQGQNFVTSYVTNATSVELMATTSPYNSKFVSVPMVDDGTNGDAVAGDNFYTAAFPWYMGGSMAKFYIRATNSDALMLNPERAEYEFWTYELPLSLEPTETLLETTIYPNPTRDIVFVQSNSVEPLSYNLINSSGVTVLRGTLTNNKIDVSSLESGVYFIQLTTSNGQSSTEKLIVQ